MAEAPDPSKMQLVPSEELDAAERALFVAELKRSHQGTAEILRWLALHDYEVWSAPPEPAPPDCERRMDYADNGDIWARKRGTEKWVRIEVKYWKKNDFNGPHDMPYPKTTVCKTYVWDNADPKPVAFFIVNPRRTKIAIVPGSTAPEWDRFTYEVNNLTHETQTVYRCPNHLLVFKDL